jgi:hypothetical protein
MVLRGYLTTYVNLGTKVVYLALLEESRFLLKSGLH